MSSEREQVASSIYREMFDIELDGIPGNERVITERITSPADISYTVFIIQRFHPSIENWHTEYTWSVEGLVDTEIENEYWNIVNSPVVILKIFERSGNFLSYRVVGYHFDVLIELLARDTIFQGNVFIDAFNIIEQTGNQYRIWLISQRELNLFPYRLPIISNAHVFKYFISIDGQVMVNSTNLTLPVGGILQFIRRDFNPISERMLYSAEEPEAIWFIQNRSAYQFRKPMNATFTIIPEGYDWENAVDIAVEVM